MRVVKGSAWLLSSHSRQIGSLEGMMLKLKLQYFGHLMRRVDSLERLWCWEGLGAGGEENDRGWDGWMASLTRWTWVSVNSGSWWWTGSPGVLRFMGSQRVGHDWATELTDTMALGNTRCNLIFFPLRIGLNQDFLCFAKKKKVKLSGCHGIAARKASSLDPLFLLRCGWLNWPGTIIE